MDNESIKNDRRDFLVKITLFVGSIFVLSNFIPFKLKSYFKNVSKVEKGLNLKKLSNQEISNELKKSHSNNIERLKPELPPLKTKKS